MTPYNVIDHSHLMEEFITNLTEESISHLSYNLKLVRQIELVMDPIAST